jgi:hypothetical protein
MGPKLVYESGEFNEGFPPANVSMNFAERRFHPWNDRFSSGDAARLRWCYNIF